jgi:hypothetical protein
MKALDPQGEARALARCKRAVTLSDEALARTQRLRDMLSDARTLSILVGVLRDLAAIEDACRPAETGTRKVATAAVATPPAAAPKRDVEEKRRVLARKLEAWVKTQEDLARG